MAAAYLAFLLLKRRGQYLQRVSVRLPLPYCIKIPASVSVSFRYTGWGSELSFSDRLVRSLRVKSTGTGSMCSEEEATFFTESFSESGDAEEMATALCSFIPFPLTVDLNRNHARDFVKVAQYCQNF